MTSLSTEREPVMKVPVAVVTAFLYLVPVVGLLSAWVLLGEVPIAMTAVGGAVAVGGIVLLNYAKARARSVLRRGALAQPALVAGEQAADVVAVAVDGQAHQDRR